MIASQAVIRHVRKTFQMLEGSDDPYTSIQIAGSDPYVMSEAARLSEDLGAKFLDINMGCPVKKIVKSDAGSALMKDEKLAGSIIESVVKSVKIPVSLKMRLGWDHDHKNSPTIARMAEDMGISMITVHGRTRSQLYNGIADWKSIKLVKDVLKNIPLIVNGDIVDINSARQALQDSNADGVMIGRGSLGQPWILKEIHNFLESGNNENLNISIEEKFKIAKKHIDYMMDFYDHETSYKLCRKVLVYYCKGIPNAAKYRQRINTVIDKNEIYDILHEFFNN